MKARSRSDKARASRFEEFRGFESRAELKEAPAPRAVAELDAKALLANYRAVSALVPGLEMIPMLKADAYGHGASWAAGLLSEMPGLHALGVATLEEGREIREALGSRRRVAITVFSGASLWSEAKGQYCERFGLTPVIASEDDWIGFSRGGWRSRLPYELKFNTGMNRLGLEPAFVSRILASLKGRPADEQPASVFTHLASADDPDHRLTRRQVESFVGIRAQFEAAMPSVRFHLANSAAIWNARRFRLDEISDSVRPGLALYGVPPLRGANARGISPVMTLKASVVQLHQLKAGECVGYGGAFRVKASDPKCRVAVLGAGYGDGIHRSLGEERGRVWLSGRSSRFLGRVSMDLSAVEAFPNTRTGDWAELLGPNVDPWAQAEAAGTIPYELLTSVSSRVQKKYV